ncbi:unnamed protein product [Arctogadus glacialis]
MAWCACSGEPAARAGVRAVYQREQYGGHVCPAVLPLSGLRSPHRGPASSTHAALECQAPRTSGAPLGYFSQMRARAIGGPEVLLRGGFRTTGDKHVVPAISRQQVRAERGVRPLR